MVTQTNVENLRALKKIEDDKLQRRLKAKGWKDNVVTRYLVFSNMTPSDFANIAGINRCVVNRWVYLEDDKLTPFCHWVFIVFAKLKLMGVSVEDCF